MSWRDILKRDSLRDLFNRKKFARNRFRGEKPTSRYMPKPLKPAHTPKPKPTPKPKRQIPARTVVDNYFEMYRNQGKGKPTLNDIKREEGRPLTVNEEEAYYRRMRE